MTFEDISKKWLEFVNKLNSKGIPVPTIRDPKTKLGSVSFTMVCISFGLMAICPVIAFGMMIAKWGGFFTSFDSSIAALKEAFWMSFQMAGLSAGLYFGRKFQKKDNTIELDKKEDQS